MLRGLGLGERASLVLLEGALVQLNHATLMVVDSLVLTLRCRQMIALRVISNDRRRAALHIIMMILITSHISVQGFPSLARMTVARRLPLDEIRINANWNLLLLLVLARRLKAVLLLAGSGLLG